MNSTNQMKNLVIRSDHQFDNPHPNISHRVGINMSKVRSAGHSPIRSPSKNSRPMMIERVAIEDMKTPMKEIGSGGKCKGALKHFWDDLEGDRVNEEYSY